MPTGTVSVWKGALKNAVSTVCGVILSNAIDPQTALLNWQWIRHVIIVSLFMLLTNEARYWKTWADKPEDNRPVVLSFFLAFFVGTGFQLFFRWMRF